MVFKTFKRMLSPSLADMIGRQIRDHKSAGYDFHKNIACVVDKDSSGLIISACLKTNNPNLGGLDISGQIWFFKSKIDSIEEGLNRLTIEVSEAHLKYPFLNFYRWFTLTENDSKEYILNKNELSESVIADMILRGFKFGEETINITEFYSAGSWQIYGRPIWQ